MDGSGCGSTYRSDEGLTDEWKRGGVTEAIDFATLTDLMSKTWSGMTTREYKRHKGLTKESLRDNMTNMELLLNALAEETATQLSKERNPSGSLPLNEAGDFDSEEELI